MINMFQSSLLRDKLDLHFYTIDQNVIFIYALVLLAIIQSVVFLIKKPLAKKGYICINGVCSLQPLPETLEEAGGSTIISTSTLLIIRLIFAIYTVGLGIYQLVIRGVFHLRFYTIWNWWILSLYFVLSSIASYRLIQRNKRSSSADSRSPNPCCEVNLARLCQAFYTITSVTVVIVDCVTWLVLVPMLTKDPRSSLESRINFEQMFYSFLSYNQHGFNAFFFFVDFMFNRQPFKFYALGYVGLWSATYAIWAQLVFVVSGRWLYPFLNINKPWSVLAYTSLYLVHWVVFALIRLLYVLKDRMLSFLEVREAAKRTRAATQTAKKQ